MIHQIADGGEQQRDKRDDGEEQLEGQRTSQEGNIVLESRLERAANDSGDGLMPAPGLHATGSSSSPAARPGCAAPRRRRFAPLRRRPTAPPTLASPPPPP